MTYTFPGRLHSIELSLMEYGALLEAMNCTPEQRKAFMTGQKVEVSHEQSEAQYRFLERLAWDFAPSVVEEPRGR